jgi:uncharacterized protein (TIGR02246 family)
MRCAAIIGLSLSLVVPGAARGQGSVAADEGAVRRLIQQHDQARTSGDWKAVASLFAEDGSTLTSAGEWRKGRAQVESGGAKSGADVYKGGKYTTRIDTVRMLAPTVALADGRFEISNIGGGRSRTGHITYVLVKSGNDWRIAGTRSMVPVPAGPSPSR